jgi:integrase
MNLRHLLDDQYAPLRGLAPKALLQYRLTIERYSEHLLREPTLADLTPISVQRFLAARKLQVSTATVVKDRTHLVALWGYAARERLVEKFPTLPPMKAPGRIPRAYTIAQVSQLIRTARAWPGEVSGLPAGVWWSTILRAGYETAERVGAMLQLRWRDVDLEAGHIVYVAETRKGATRDIQRPISPGLASWLRLIQRGPGDLVWPWVRHRESLWYDLKKLTKAAGVPHRGFHALRKTAASYVAKAGGDATGLLDHSDPRITRDSYVDPSIAPPRSSLDDLPPLDLGEEAA